MKIAIVGAAGQVGATILRHLAKHSEHTVFGVTRNEFAAAPLRHEGLEIRVGEVTDPNQCRHLLASADVIVNAALHLGLPKHSRLQNRAIIRNLIQESGNAAVVHFSTVAVYGSCHDNSYSTFDRPRGDSTYAKGKLKLEYFGSDLSRKNRKRLAMLRLGHVYGPGQGLSKQFFSELESGNFCLPFDGLLLSNTVHVHRLAEAIPALVMGLDGVKTWNAVNEPQVSWRDVYNLHSHAAQLPLANAVSDSESLFWQRIHREKAQRSMVGRLFIAGARWLRRLPVKSLADDYAVRETMDALMLRLPLSFEKAVYRRYQGFAGAHRVTAHKAVTAPPWYYSDPVPGPNALQALSAAAEEERAVQELQDLTLWYKSFSLPEWGRKRHVGG